MRRDVDELAHRTFDVLVVGGGIYGLTIACDAAGRGLSVGLIERDDFGSGSSFNHLRTIHGGLRYLQTLDTGRARESVRERRTLARIAPHAVRKMRFVLPLSRSVSRGKLAMRAGFLLDRATSWDRNDGVPESLALPAGRVISRRAALEGFPEIQPTGLTGAAVWYDYVTIEADRLTFAWALSAAEHGAVLANHVEATGLIIDGGRAAGVNAFDRVQQRNLQIRAHVTVNATGAAINRLLDAPGLPRTLSHVPLLKAMNLVTARDGGDTALGGRSPAGRNLFRVPWRGKALFGTWESRQTSTSDDTRVAQDEIDRFIDELNRTFLSLELRRADVTLVHRGLVPAVSSSNGTVRLESHERISDHATEGLDGLFTVAGTKYTTARAVAERVVDRLLVKLKRPASPSLTATEPLPGGDLGDTSAALSAIRRDTGQRLPDDTAAHLVAVYGSRYRDLLPIAEERREWATRLADGSPVVGAELIWAVRHEMAVTLADAVIRRTPLGALGYPGDAANERAAEIVGAELGWGEEQKQREIEAVRSFYR